MKKPLQVIAEGKAPINILFDRSEMRCTVCENKAGTCDCWTKCGCGWSFRKSTKCNNPDCGITGE